MVFRPCLFDWLAELLIWIYMIEYMAARLAAEGSAEVSK
jgi:hypothetical protein